mmetsp:Transcript_25200/g.28786  ORF Transcript_25200/g.28786 Transcript_25200/m.28786 type:complete len:377 (-) Transcript_25200:140-1270(-)
MPAIIQSYPNELSAFAPEWKHDMKVGIDNTTTTTTTANKRSSIVVPHPDDPSRNAVAYFDGYGYVVSTDNVNKQHQTHEEEGEDTVPGFVPSDTSSDEFTSDDDEFTSDDESDAADKYGYGEAAPDEPKVQQMGLPSPQYRRASISRRNRRASISIIPTLENFIGDSMNAPFDPQRTPRRSSLKGASKSSALRRASIGAFSYDALDIQLLQEIAPEAVYEVQLPGRRESITRRRSITFNNDVEIRNIQPAKNLTNKPNELWLQDDEYHTIEKETQVLLDAVDKETDDGNKYCVRGLEQYMDSSSDDNVCEAAWNTVLQEQQIQRQDGRFCDESIGNLYRAQSARSVVVAQRQGMLDAEEVVFNNNTTTRGRRASIA